MSEVRKATFRVRGLTPADSWGVTFKRFTIRESGLLCWLVKIEQEHDAVYVWQNGWQLLGHKLDHKAIATLLRVIS